MADLLQLRGLVAAGTGGTGPRPVDDLPGPARPAAVDGEAGPPRGAPPADRVEVRPAGELDLRPREMELRQRAVTALQSRAEALERVTARLTELRQGQPGAAEALGNEVANVRGLVEPGQNLARLLVQVDPNSAGAVDPGLLETTLVETENALAATYGNLKLETGGLSAAQVAVENESAARVDTERLARAAERIRRQESEGEPVEMLEALRGPAISRNRVVELLIR
jgi:hypothetical protein